MKNLITLFVFLFSGQIVFSQGVGVGTNTPHASAALEVTSTTQGMLVPRMTTEQRTLITGPAMGLLVFDITSNSFWFRNSNSWVELVDSVNTEVHRSAADKIYMGMTDNVGVGIATPLNKLDVHTGAARTGTHSINRPLYVTGDIGEQSNGIEFLHTNGTQGIGFGYNTIYVTGSHSTLDLRLAAKGVSGNLLFSTNNTEKMRITATGNVGIGQANPHAPLQFNQAEQNRKIVLYENANDDHQFFGFGVNSFTLRYQVPATNFNHIFYTGTSSSTSSELMRIQGNGRVGLGIASPEATLDIAKGTAPNGTLQVRGSTHNTHINYGVPEDTYLRGGKAGAKVFINDLGGLGNVIIGSKLGLGNATPNAWLQFPNTTENRKIVLWQGNNNDHEFYGLGVNGSILRYQVSNTGDNHVFYAAGSATTSNELMRIQGNGNVGIGISNATNLLDVHVGAVRTGTHATNRPLYITGDFGSQSNGVEFVHNNSTEGIGFGYNTIYAAGTNASQNLGMAAKGTAGNLLFSTNGVERMRIRETGEIVVANKIESEPFIEPALQNGFTNYGNGYATIAYYKDAMGIVHLRGTFATTLVLDGDIIFYLPQAYWPWTSGILAFPINLAGVVGQAGQVKITSNGAVSIYLNAIAGSLDGISFRAD